MATTMQTEIPWNVAGIAPEAREAARASARREGLSVGEWLTRRILRGLSESGAAPDEWWFAENARTPSNENPVANGRPRNDDGLRNLLQQANKTRHSTQIRSVSGDAAAPLKLPTYKDSEPVEPLNDRIVRLDARIARVEIRAAAEEAKHAETVRSLQAKLADLTGLVSRTAAHSVAQDSQLAKAIAGVTENVLRSQGEADENYGAMKARIESLAEDNGVMNTRISTFADDAVSLGEKLAESRAETERQLRDVEGRISETQITVEAVRRDAGELDRLGGSLDHLTQRFETADTEYLNNVERFEGRLARIEANSGEAIIDRRLQSIEQALADMARLIEKNAPEKPAVIEAPEQTADSKPKVTPRDVPPHVPPFAATTATPILDLPPFPEKPTTGFAPLPETAAPQSGPDLRAAANSPPVFGHSEKKPSSAEVDSFLAAARRTAHAGNAPQPRAEPFSWIDLSGQKRAEATHTRLFLLGGLGLLILAAIGLGFYLSSTHGPSVASTTAESAHYAAVPKARQPVRVQSQPGATQLAASPAPAKQPGFASASNPAPVRTSAGSRGLTTAVQRRLVPPTSATQNARTATPAKPPTLQQRLATLANAGQAKAQEVLGLAYLDGDGVAVNEAEGAKWLQRAAAHGEAVAAYRLGTLYERGHGVAADPAKAAQWYAVAAKAGNRKAMHNLAVAYAQGAGVQKDMALAAQWFSRAANLGLADSQFNLAVLYERGLGVSQSLDQAYRWYAIAAAQGDAGSRTRMDAIATQLNADDKAAAEKSAAIFQAAPLDRAANAPPIAASLTGGA